MFVATVPVVLALALLSGLAIPNLVNAPAAGESGLRFFTGVGFEPEPQEQVRYLLFLLAAPAVLATAVLLARVFGNRRVPRLLLLLTSLLVELVGGAAMVSWWASQQEDYPYFSGMMLLFAVVTGAAVATAALLVRPYTPRWPGRRRNAAAAVVAGLLTGIALLPSIFHETNIAGSLPVVHFHLAFTMDEFAAVANGRTPLVDFVPQYSNVLPYLLSPFLSGMGFGVGAFTGAMFVLSLSSLLSVFYVLARVTGKWVTALALYLPFLYLSLYRSASEGDQHAFIANYFAVMPLRYLGPWLVAAAVVWQLRRPSARRLFVLFLVAGTMALNNPDFGVPTFVACIGATWLGAGRDAMRSPAWAGRVLAGAGAGMGAAAGTIALVSVLRSGRLPNFGLSLYFARQFAVSGFNLLPMPSSGLHLVIGVTLASALVRAVLRGASADHQDSEARLLSGSLAYGAIFGLGASSYYVGRSHPHVLIALFSAWAFVLVLLMWDAWRELRRDTHSRPGTKILWVVPAVLLAGHLALAAAPGWQMREVGRQLRRISQEGMPPILRNDRLAAYVRLHTRPGESVAILSSLSHRTALAAGVRDVVPYNSILSIITYEQLDVLRDRLRAERVRSVFSDAPLAQEVLDLLRTEGFRRASDDTDLTRPILWRRPEPPRTIRSGTGPDG